MSDFEQNSPQFAPPSAANPAPPSAAAQPAANPAPPSAADTAADIRGRFLTAEGFDFAFDPSACERCGGHCCTGESGYIFTTPAEREELAKVCGIALSEFEQCYTYRVGARRSLREKPDPRGGAACVFFDLERRCCSVYAARPAQCRSFPFWRGYSKEELCAECIGVCDLAR